MLIHKYFFNSANGEKVHCEDKCSQPVSFGICRAAFKRYFFNSTTMQCQEFIYGGCQGNDNNFKSLEQCQMECESQGNVFGIS